jgi:hypothetical protein
VHIFVWWELTSLVRSRVNSCLRKPVGLSRPTGLHSRQDLDRKQAWSRSFGPASRGKTHEYIFLAHCIYLFIVYSCPVAAVLVGALIAHIDAMPTQPSKKRKHEPYSNSEKAWLLILYDESPKLSAQELGERLAEREFETFGQSRPETASWQGHGQRLEEGCSHNQGEVSE